MNKILLLFVITPLAIACGSPGANRASSSASNVNANAVPYSQTENGYELAQRDVDLAWLENSAGKTASELNLWQNKEVVRQFKHRMGPDFATMMKYWNTETPIKKFGDVLMLTGCERDNCSNNRYVVFLSLSESLISVVHVGRDTVREWNTRDRTLGIPPPFAEELAKMKSGE